MKEATGELNMTVITVVAIAALAGIFYVFVWPAIQDNLQARTACSQGPNTKNDIAAGSQGHISCAAATSGSYTCDYVNAKGSTKTTTCSQNL